MIFSKLEPLIMSYGPDHAAGSTNVDDIIDRNLHAALEQAPKRQDQKRVCHLPYLQEIDEPNSLPGSDMEVDFEAPAKEAKLDLQE